MSSDIRLIMRTSKGDMEILTYASRTPITCASFINLATQGYYNNVIFHRVVPNFVIQAGDPTGTGTGGPGYKFEDECFPDLKHDSAGILSMANPGKPNSNGSQFFITHRATPHLDMKHTVFGCVTVGVEVVNTIVKGDFITQIDLVDPVDQLWQAMGERIAKWNEILRNSGRV